MIVKEIIISSNEQTAVHTIEADHQPDQALIETLVFDHLAFGEGLARSILQYADGTTAVYSHETQRHENGNLAMTTTAPDGTKSTRVFSDDNT